MFQKTLRIRTNDEYTFKANRDSNIVKVLEGERCLGWVSNQNNSGGMHKAVSVAARTFLYSVRPELNPARDTKGKGDSPAIAAKPKPGECCEAMRLVIPRAELLQHRHGLVVMELINTRTGVISRYVSLKFPKDPDRLAPHAKTTVLALNFCPFCGTELEGEKEDSFEEAEDKKEANASGKSAKEAAGAAAKGGGGKKRKAAGASRGLPSKRGASTRGGGRKK